MPRAELEPIVIQQINQANSLRQTASLRLEKAQSLIPQGQDSGNWNIREMRQSFISERLEKTATRKLAGALEIEEELKPFYPQIIEYYRWEVLRTRRDLHSINLAQSRELAKQIPQEQMEKFNAQLSQIEAQYNHYISLSQSPDSTDTKIGAEEEGQKLYRVTYNPNEKIIQIGNFQTIPLSDSEAKFIEILDNNDNLGEGFTNEALRSMLQANGVKARPKTLANSIRKKLPGGMDIFQILESDEGVRWLLLKKVSAGINEEELKQPSFAFIKHETPFKTRDYSHIIERVEVKKRLEEIADPQIRATITEFLKTEQANYLLTAAADFKPEDDNRRKDFVKVMVSSFFEMISYHHLKPVYENEPNIIFLSPMDTQTVYENLFPDIEPIDSDNYHLTYGLEGISVPDGMLIEEGDDSLILREIIEYKNTKDGPENAKRIREQLANFTQEVMTVDFKQNDPGYTEFLGQLIHILHPEINPKPLIIKLGFLPTIVLPKNSTFKTIHAVKSILPLETTELHNLVATLYELVRKPTETILAEPKSAIISETAIGHVNLTGISDKVTRQLAVPFLVQEAFDNLTRVFQDTSFAPSPEARTELKNKIPEIDDFIKRISELVRGKKLPKSMSLEQVKKAFPELESGMVWITLSNNTLDLPDSEIFNTLKIVSLLFVNQYGAALSKEAILELPIKVKEMLALS